MVQLGRKKETLNDSRLRLTAPRASHLCSPPSPSPPYLCPAPRPIYSSPFPHTTLPDSLSPLTCASFNPDATSNKTNCHEDTSTPGILYKSLVEVPKSTPQAHVPVHVDLTKSPAASGSVSIDSLRTPMSNASSMRTRTPNSERNARPH